MKNPTVSLVDSIIFIYRKNRFLQKVFAYFHILHFNNTCSYFGCTSVKHKHSWHVLICCSVIAYSIILVHHCFIVCYILFSAQPILGCNQTFHPTKSCPQLDCCNVYTVSLKFVSCRVKSGTFQAVCQSRSRRRQIRREEEVQREVV